MLNLKNKIILITGATGGIGQALAQNLAQQDTQLILLGHNSDKLKKLTTSLGKNYDSFVCNLTNSAEVKKLAETIKNKYKKIDILINIAGIGIYKKFPNITDEEWKTSFDLNVGGYFLITKYFLPLLEKSDISLVLNIGSGAGVIPMKERSLYCATKFAVRGMTLSLAAEYENKKPHFCLITLGSVLTPFANVPLEEKIKKNKNGTAFFTPQWVATKLTEIMQDEKRKVEYILYPSDYGFGTWKKP